MPFSCYVCLKEALQSGEMRAVIDEAHFIIDGSTYCMDHAKAVLRRAAPPAPPKEAGK